MSGRAFKISSVLLALACAVVEALILRHTLVDCLPFKEMREAPEYARGSLVAGTFSIVAVAGLAGLLISSRAPRRSWLVLVVLAVLTPVIFMAVVRYAVPPTTGPFLQRAPDLAPSAAWRDLLEASGFTAFAGVVATILGGTLLVILLQRAQRALPNPSSHRTAFGGR